MGTLTENRRNPPLASLLTQVRLHQWRQSRREVDASWWIIPTSRWPSRAHPRLTTAATASTRS